MDLSEESIKKTKSLILENNESVQVVTFQANITNESTIRGMVDKCVESFGRLDFAVNNAGTGTANVKTDAVSVEEFDRVCDVNIKGVSQRLLPVIA